MTDVEFQPSDDGLYRDLPLDQVTELPVLGVPVRFESNSPTVRACVEESFGVWRGLAGRRDLLASEQVRVRLIVHHGAAAPAGRAPMVYRMPSPDRRLILAAGSAAVAELPEREGYAYLAPAVVADRAQFRYGLVEALTYMLVTQLDRHPLHAAAVVRGGSTILLAGPSGVGKSSLAYAAWRTGLRVLSEDAVYLQLEPVFRVWGSCSHLHLPADAPRWFPELSGRPTNLLANGKRKISVALPESDLALPVPAEGRVGVCLVRRGGDGPVVERIAPTAVWSALMADMKDMGFDVFAEAIGPRLERLVGAGGWRLSLAGDTIAEVGLLQRMLDELDRLD